MTGKMVLSPIATGAEAIGSKDVDVLYVCPVSVIAGDKGIMESVRKYPRTGAEGCEDRISATKKPLGLPLSSERATWEKDGRANG
ncbi:hypothetical protein SERLADRAFT_395184 [Serpula lacrymans var. lacrymans S7.9]|uniref:Uncharacterized protein n=1 Tax=Serpula lacrymans var. lacrymans (strain S7.9) TaxID=578457 RepID=F8P422_SERL9|nr:uncharacterized protein SERLADRAFT_395184 [Serpula lacrymans var. lacrymans S7.9]EGO22270.1 hypothetical protein SERLADRAFT_395184 [Serpula lacrymans var. lacrymans S7.9]